MIVHAQNVMQAFQYYTTFDSDRIFVKGMDEEANVLHSLTQLPRPFR
jgi:hypothetical protein